ncbi:hypothetical protein AUEXF2481DRAFT_35034 [Aureobasidium subglaciale EXF-2481]|uniref:Uncharacterized protein n=1 Tax=Aureobasidium subglaciale (strain EXF-2481) TaxID=1043005 RepID=A0A074YSX5_AURSE|nr:uncharacterized protein AUEXF2481DRAFT_35034 [Aureobasidium subglaciale EXF-2481]KER00786.1 hypothetical protein AUEXF2481DRAFT_35034 [Aureobasidium subglaciale EXF-2481]
MLSFLTPPKTIITPSPSFSHHERFASHLVADTPSPCHHNRWENLDWLTNDLADHVVRNARSFAARSSRSFATSDTLHPPAQPESRQSSAPALAEIDPNNQNLRPVLAANRYRPSPTPSLKKRKAEQILKDHGSPPGLRVTAGGRIVPSDQSPLCSPRYGYSAIKKNGMLIKFGPNFPAPPGGIPMQRMGLPNGFVAQDPDGRLCQMVDGKFLPVDDVDGIPQLYIAAPNLTSSTGFPAGEKEDAAGSTPFDTSTRQQQPSQTFDKAPPTGPSLKQPTMKQPVISAAMQIQALEKQYSKLEQESKDLDKVEVLQRSSMSSKAYNQLVQTRRELVSRMNSIRVSLKSLREAKSSTDHSPQAMTQPMQPQFSMQSYGPAAMMGPSGPIPDWAFDGIAHDAHNMPPFHGAPMPQGLGYYGPPPGYPGPMAPYPGMYAAMPPMFNMMGMPPVDAFGNFMPGGGNMDPQAFSNGSPPAPRAEAVQNTAASSRGPAEDTTTSQQESQRRTHALQIKNPENKSESSQKSALNPMSPSYQPAGKSTPTSKVVPTRAASPSPALAEAVRQHNAWITESANASATNLNSAGSQRKLRYESSSSSYATADFFPNNPRDHSMRKDAYPVTHDRNASRSKMAERPSASSEQPVTPDKENQDPGWSFAPVASVTTPPTMQGQAVDQFDAPATDDLDPVHNRSEMNVSPKNRRPDYVSSQKSVSESATFGSGLPSPAIGSSYHTQSQQILPTASSEQPSSSEESTYMDGFKAGEARLPVSVEKNGAWLNGYCAGLLKSAQPTVPSVPPLSEASAPVRAGLAIVRPYLHQEQKSFATQRAMPAIGVHTMPMNTLRDVAFSTQNENTILTPDPNGPCVNDMAALHLGNWNKAHQSSTPAETDAVLGRVRNGEAVLPERTSSAMQRQVSNVNASTEHSRSAMPLTQTAGATIDRGRISQDRRATSAQIQTVGGSPTAYFQRVYPAHRVMSSQLEWKSGSSIAQVAGLATGYFAQYDGMRTGANTIGDRQPLTQMSGNTGMTTHDTMSGALPEKQTSMSARFTEGSMPADIKTSSPSSSPGKRSPTKGSPAKVKFAQIAGRAGIKVRNDSRDEQESEPSSPQEKRRWRDVWTKRFAEGEQKPSGRH